MKNNYYTAIDFHQEEKENKRLREHLKHLFNDPHFRGDVFEIRNLLGLRKTKNPPLRINDLATPDQEKENYERYLAIMSVTCTDSELKKYHLDIKSEKGRFERNIRRLLNKYHLPIRFEGNIASIVLYGNYPKIYSHLNKWTLKVEHDKGQPKLFIEIFADTTTSDLAKALKTIKVWQKADFIPKLSGGHLSKEKNFFLYNRAQRDGVIEDAEGNVLFDYDQINVMKHRYRKSMK